MKKKFFIIDAFGLIFRSYYAMIKNPLKTKDGIPTSAILGFTRALLKIHKDYNPDYLLVAFDSEGKGIRGEKFPKYKANRKPPPDDLKVQIPKVIELIKAFNIPNLSVNGYEADDIIASACNQFGDDETETYIVSGDKDILQLVNDNTKVYAPQRTVSEFKLFNREKVIEKWKVEPEHIKEILALMGDSSDNIPGVKGVGEKTAKSLISKYKTLENLYDNIGKEPKRKIISNLIEEKENAFLSRELVTLYDKLDLNLSKDDLKYMEFYNDKSIELLKKYELTSIISDKHFQSFKRNTTFSEADKSKNYKEAALFEIDKEEADESTSYSLDEKAVSYNAITKKSEFIELISKIEEQKLVSFDLETDSEIPVSANIIGFGLSYKTDTAYYVPMKHDVETEFDEEWLLEQVKHLLENKNISKIGQNLKFDYLILKRYGIELEPISFDTMLASYVLDPEQQSHGMDHLALEWLGYKTISYKDIVPKGSTLLETKFDKVVNYACEDVDITLKLYETLKPKIDASISKDLFYNIELPLINVLAQMELNGVVIDVDYFKKLSGEFEDELNNLEKRIHELAGEEFNVNSPKQLQNILFDKLGLKPGRKTKSGFSTDVKVLESLAEEHEVPRLLLSYRTLSKLNNAYLDSLPKLINKETERIHTSFNQTITSTGRLSSNNPNLQNIPIRGDFGKDIRKGFVSPEGHFICSGDYSQIELRILAHVSEDETLIKAYNEGKDIHAQTASLIFDKDIDEVTGDERGMAKTINFGIIYGMGSVSLGKQLGISSKEAKQFIENYFEHLNGVKRFIERQKSIAYKDGYVSTLFNRIRHLPHIRNRSGLKRSKAERDAVNSLIQGTSADIIKVAMIDIHSELQKRKMKSKMTIQVHDELVFEVIKDEYEELKELVIDKMTNAAKLKVPLTVNFSKGKNWDEAH